jgi:lon-related putative ATP-dependent protease
LLVPGISEHIRGLAVPTEQLRKVCEPFAADRAGPADEQLASLTYLGQKRAVDSLRFGIEMEQDGYNVFVLGPLGSHRHELVEKLARTRAAEKGAPDDWCYTNNFVNSERPCALRLPPGKGIEFRDEMQALIEEIRLAIPAVFEDEDYRNQLKALEAETQKDIEEQWRSIEKEAEERDIAVLQTPTGYVLAPMSKGKVIDDKDFDKLPEETRKKIRESIEHLSKELQARIERLPKLRKQQHERIRALDQEVAAHTVTVLIQDLRAKYESLPEVVMYLDGVQRDIIENSQEFRQSGEPTLPFMHRDSAALLARYEVNLIVSNEPGTPAPIIYEPNPSYPNLIGKVEHRAEMGALLTDFRMVRSGALQQANGGYLILDIHRVLSRPFVWEGLKQALFAKKVRIESPADTLGFVSTTTLKPEPIPLDIKVILIGERWLFYLLSMYDKEFGSLFKVAADLDDDMKRSDDNVQAYSRLVEHRIGTGKLRPFTMAAIQRVIEQRSRQAGDSERLSMNIRSLDDLLVQADYWARQRNVDQVDAEDVDEAIRRQKDRLSRVQTRIVEAIERDTLLIDTSGECVGQVNGLSVVELGDYRFGHPVRITATTRLGSGDVVDIEREVELGGAIHSKGVMILSAALSSRYAPDTPLSLQGSIVFEQSYGGVDGDSASVAEFCALLSSLARAPIRQNIACTGSVNQLGRVQAVGGVNEKIEGFFEICRKRGLDGSHAVVIPADNVKHLMLGADIVDAAQNGQFTVYAVHDIDDAIEVLTGRVAGERDDDGQFAADTVNRLVEDQLVRFASQRKQFAEAGNANG